MQWPPSAATLDMVLCLALLPGLLIRIYYESKVGAAIAPADMRESKCSQLTVRICGRVSRWLTHSAATAFSPHCPVLCGVCTSALRACRPLR
jgi:hypothetical protein